MMFQSANEARSDIEAIYLPESPQKVAFRVDGMRARRVRPEEGFEIAPPISKKRAEKIQAIAIRTSFASNEERMRYAKRLLRERRKRSGLVFKARAGLAHWIATHPGVAFEREAILLLLLTGVIFQLGLLAHNLGFIQ